jgi:hypothetical protein
MGKKKKAKEAVAAEESLTGQFNINDALKIACDATLFDGVTPETTLEDANMRTPDERELYALRVIGLVAHKHAKMKKTQVPQKATTKVIEVARAIVIFAD